MPRPQRCRRICRKPEYSSFKPENDSSDGTVMMSVDEYEVIRLVDYEQKTHEECAKQMDISRTTVTEIYESARFKIADSLVNGKTLIIEGGNFRLCDGSGAKYCNIQDCKQKESYYNDVIKIAEGVNTMKVAVTYENGNIFQHFGHTEQFKLYEIENGKILNQNIVDTNGQGHGALSGFLAGYGIDTLICGGIGGGAQAALADAGIKLYGGVSGNADEAVKALMDGTLGYNPDVHCNHHDHEHTEDEHACGSHGCGSHNCQ